MTDRINLLEKERGRTNVSKIEEKKKSIDIMKFEQQGQKIIIILIAIIIKISI